MVGKYKSFRKKHGVFFNGSHRNSGEDVKREEMPFQSFGKRGKIGIPPKTTSPEDVLFHIVEQRVEIPIAFLVVEHLRKI